MLLSTSCKARKIVLLTFIAVSLSVSGPVLADIVKLVHSSPLVLRSGDNPIIENISIDAGSEVECAIDIRNLSDVLVRNVEIKHANVGICIQNAPNLTIENVRLTSTSSVAAGPHCIHGLSGCLYDVDSWAAPNDRLAISALNSENSSYTRIAVSGSSTGFYINNSPNTHVSTVTCENMRGPFPRGQCVQFVHSDGSSLDNFYAKNTMDISHGEDNVNAFMSDNISITNGLIDGNFSIHGIGVIADSGSDNMRVVNVDITNTANGAISVWSNDVDTVGKNFYAENVRVKNTLCESRQNLLPSSGGLVAANHPVSINPTFISIQYFNHCRNFTTYCVPGQSCRLNDTGTADFREEDFVLKEPLQIFFPWDYSPDSISDF